MKTYKRIELEEVFAIKGWYWDDRKTRTEAAEKTVSGSIIMGGTKYNYEINNLDICLSTGDDKPTTTSSELWEGYWLVFYEKFEYNGYPFRIMCDDEFNSLYQECEPKNIKILNIDDAGIERKKYDIEIDFLINNTGNRRSLWPNDIKINGEKPSKQFLFRLGAQIMELSRPDDCWDQEPTVKAKTTKPPRSGYVYLMVDHNTGYHKIGFSKDPKHREKTLQSEKPTIELLHKFEGTMQKEKELHTKYDPKRIRGEWFNLDKKDIKYIKSL